MPGLRRQHVQQLQPRPLVAEVLVDGDQTRLIRRRQTVEEAGAGAAWLSLVRWARGPVPAWRFARGISSQPGRALTLGRFELLCRPMVASPRQPMPLRPILSSQP